MRRHRRCPLPMVRRDRTDEVARRARNEATGLDRRRSRLNRPDARNTVRHPAPNHRDLTAKTRSHEDTALRCFAFSRPVLAAPPPRPSLPRDDSMARLATIERTRNLGLWLTSSGKTKNREPSHYAGGTSRMARCTAPRSPTGWTRTGARASGITAASTTFVGATTMQHGDPQGHVDFNVEVGAACAC